MFCKNKQKVIIEYKAPNVFVLAKYIKNNILLCLTVNKEVMNLNWTKDTLERLCLSAGLGTPVVFLFELDDGSTMKEYLHINV